MSAHWKFLVKIGSPRDAAVFIAHVHKATNPHELHLDPKEFYERCGKPIPSFPQHELELVKPSQEDLRVPLHLHLSRLDSTRRFVCAPMLFPEPSTATKIFITWCLGSMGTMMQDVDLNTSLKAAGKADYPEYMRNKYGIYVITTRLSGLR